MRTNIGAVSVLALLVLSAARAGAACAGDQPPPKMTINLHKGDYENIYETKYGENLVIHCSGEDIRMKVNRQPVQAVTINMTTVQLKVYKPGFGKYEYLCTDIGTGCEVSLGVRIRPAMTVKAKAPYRLYDGWHSYFVPLGEEYQVLCSGHPGASLLIGKGFDPIQTDVFNSTTSIHTTRADRVEDKVPYWCRGTETTVEGEESYVWCTIKVTVDYYPQCEDFRCVIYDWEILECTWQYPTDRFTFSLFYTDHDDNNKGATKELLCDDMMGKMNNTCRKNIKKHIHETITLNQNISLLLMTCYKTFCFNETFKLNTNSLIKLEKVAYLHALQVNSHEAVMKWWSSNIRIPSAGDSAWAYSYCHSCVFRVEFRQPAVRNEWRQVGSTSVLCEGRPCEFALPLPYPDTEYEVRVSIRHEDATDDRVWSDPASVLVRTERRAACVCKAALHTPAGPTVSTEAAKCEACTLTESFIKESFELKNKITFLKEKLAKAKKISELLYEAKKIADRIKTLD